MSITYDDKEIEFFNFPIERVILALSGGTDSAAILYLICKKFPEVEIIPYNCQDVNNPYDIQAAEKIIEIVKGKFPNNNIRDLVRGTYNDGDESLFPEAIEAIKRRPEWSTEQDKADGTKSEHLALLKKYCPSKHTLDFYIEYFNRKNVLLTLTILNRVTKTLFLNKLKDELRVKYIDGPWDNRLLVAPDAYIVNGMTNNPPIEVQKKYPVMLQWAETRRNPSDKIKNTIDYRTYYPFANVDKKFIAAIFKDEKLMETIFPLTRSCVGIAELTDNYTKECHQCFWCYEKKWAFDLKW